MASLSHLLNDSAGASASNPPALPPPPVPPGSILAKLREAEALKQTGERPKKKRPSRAAAAFLVDDDLDGLARRSSRQSTKPKRYAEELYDDDGNELSGDVVSGYTSAFTMPGRTANGQFLPRGSVDAAGDPIEQDNELPSDEEGAGLLRATAHIWREPLQAYILASAAKRKVLEDECEQQERSRHFLTAARVTESAERRLEEMRLTRELRIGEIRLEEERRKRREEEERLREVLEEEKRAVKEREKEERLRKQREAARKKRDEERARKERDEEARRARAERDRMAKLAEIERKNALTPEEREREEAEERARLQREKEEALRRVQELDQELLESAGRGGRKKRRKEEQLAEQLAREGSAKSFGYGRYGDGLNGDEVDELADDDDSITIIGGLGKPPRRRVSRRSVASALPPDGGYQYNIFLDTGYYLHPMVNGNPVLGYNPYAHLPPPPPPPPMPHGAYIGADGFWYDTRGQPIPMPGYGAWQQPPYPAGPSSSSSSNPYPAGPHGDHYHGGSEAGSDAGYGYGDAGPEVDDILSMTGKGSKSSKVVATKRWKAIEELEKKVWTQIAKRDIPKVVRVTQQSTSSRQFFSKRLSTIVAREARRASQKTKGVKDVQIRAKKVMREMMVFMKGNEKRERESRKKAEKEALDKAKKEEDMREAQRAARKLNFLITQTELYSHFIGNKIKTSEAEESEDTAGAAPPAQPEKSASLLAAIAAGDVAPDAQLKELDFDIDDETTAAQHARRNAQAAIDAAKEAAAAFDAAAAEGGIVAASKPVPAESDTLAHEELDFQNPTAMNGDIQVKQPKILTCTLKEYQLKGLNWLANLYEQGINGILADEMGLGKTVQSISLMAYLAEVHNIWGPFLVIAPASTLHNWQQEITRFVPALKALPYWGNTKDRAVLRKFWNRKSLRYDKDAPFHILVTSYQLVVQDEKYFQGVKWQYMVLDEAQAIKSSTSARWKTLLGFRCRNRLLLTGTPIQNSMHELWALLHFIMPSLFDSHDEFSEWFSKDIEGNAEKQGAMNEHQLRRLHMILKPFMLRRIKKNVQNELGDKIEIDLYCDLTPRQKTMYRTLRENISITDLVSRAASLNDDDSVKRLMNLIMQFRKVCNHPELFERADVTAPFAFASFNESANLIRDPEMLEVPYATKSIIEFRVPKLVYRDGGMLSTVGENSRAGTDSLYLDRLMNIWTPDYIQRSLDAQDSTFAFAQGLRLSAGELSKAAKSHGVLRLGRGLARLNSTLAREEYNSLSTAEDTPRPALTIDVAPRAATLPFDHTWRARGLTPLGEVEQNYRLTSRLGRPDARFYMDTAVAPAINAVCSDRSFTYDQDRERFDPLFSAALFGLPAPSQNSRKDIEQFEAALPGFPAEGVLAASSAAQLPFPPMQVPQLQKLILDSGKLAKLDTLLAELKANGHRVLIYFQMTRMIDLMEEYLAFRQFKYLRLDGSSTISERRDMVMDWQTKPELFIFLLSTRAGGLGINLTAADTVVFYDSDWNPSNDAQAMDRAHRLGQTKQVTVYRLITKDTVDERIVQLARNKKLVQDAVVGSSSAAPTDSGAKTNEVVSLLLGEDELQESLRQAEIQKKRREEKARMDGVRGAKVREENKKSKAEAAALAAEAKKKKALSNTWIPDDDEDAFSFFTNPVKVANDDDDDGQPSGTATPTVAIKGKKKNAPKKRKAADDGDDGEDGASKPKKAKPRKKKEPAVSVASTSALPSAAASPMLS